MTTNETRPYIGGQAVIEGVMMRAPGGVSIAVRRPDGALVVRDGPLPANVRKPYWKLPGLRGIATLIESFSLGYKALQFSAEQQEAAAPAPITTALRTLAVLPILLADGGPVTDAAEPAAVVDAPAAKREDAGARLAMIASTVFALGLFFALPQLLATGAGWALGLELGLDDWRFHALTGACKLVVLTTYLASISAVPEIRRVFQYHGAEHKTIFAYESGLDPTVAYVQSQSTLHPRCGTTFLVTVVFVGIVLGSILTPLLLPGAHGLSGQLATLALRISLIPAIAAISYELQRFSARYCTTGPMRVMLWPGFLFQKITTREPDDAQVEVAIAAMQSAVGRAREDASEPERTHVFDSLAGVVAHYGARAA